MTSVTPSPPVDPQLKTPMRTRRRHGRAFICIPCATRYAPAKPPDTGAICDEKRQYVPPSGPAWTTLKPFEGPWPDAGVLTNVRFAPLIGCKSPLIGHSEFTLIRRDISELLK